METAMTRQIDDAYHESAHAVMSIYVDEPFDYIIMFNQRIGDRIHTGRVVYPKLADGLGEYITTKKGFFKHAGIHLAGAVANKILKPGRTYKQIFADEAHADIQFVQEMISLLLFNEPEYANLDADQKLAVQKFIMKTLLPQVRKIIKQQWKYVMIVGNALIEKARLEYAEVLILMKDQPLRQGECVL
jgi:hypothetical protein